MANWLSLDHAFQQGPQLCHHSRRSLRYGVILTDIHFSLLSILPLVAVATRFLCLTVTVQSAMQGALHHLRLASYSSSMTQNPFSGGRRKPYMSSMTT